MSPDMIAALAQQRASATGFFEIQLPSGTRRLLLGSGEVSYGGNTYKGFDATIGSISSGDPVREDTTGEAPNTTLTITVSSSATKSDIAGAAIQLSPVKVSLAALALDANKHQIAIPDPELLGSFFIDQAVSSLDKQKDEVTYNLISAFDYFFEDSEGQRLSDAFHQALFSGEKGLANVTGVTKKVYWGTLGPNSANVGSSGVGTGGGLTSGLPRSIGLLSGR